MKKLLMGKTMNRMIGNYQLREAAGSYWLIDMTQTGKEWTPPLRLNESGARIVQGLGEQRTADELVAELADYYGLSIQQMSGDVNAFLAQLRVNGITFT